MADALFLTVRADLVGISAQEAEAVVRVCDLRRSDQVLRQFYAQGALNDELRIFLRRTFRVTHSGAVPFVRRFLAIPFPPLTPGGRPLSADEVDARGRTPNPLPGR